MEGNRGWRPLRACNIHQILVLLFVRQTDRHPAGPGTWTASWELSKMNWITFRECICGNITFFDVWIYIWESWALIWTRTPAILGPRNGPTLFYQFGLRDAREHFPEWLLGPPFLPAWCVSEIVHLGGESDQFPLKIRVVLVRFQVLRAASVKVECLSRFFVVYSGRSWPTFRNTCWLHHYDENNCNAGRFLPDYGTSSQKTAICV